MKKITLALACAFVMNATVGADINKSVAITPNLTIANEGTKIGFVDPYKVIQGLEQWRDQGMKIQKELQTKNEQIETKKTAYSTKLSALQSMASTAKPEVVTAKSVELKQLEIEINALTQSLQEHAERVAQEAQMTVFKDIEAAAQDIAMEKGFDIVLAGGVLFVSSKLDISAEVITRMNANYANKKKQYQKTTAAKTTIK